MKIVVYYGFTEKELDLMKDRVAKLGHELIHVTTDEEAIAHIDKAEVLMGHFSPVVTNAGKRLKWIQSFSAGMDKLLDKDITERDDLTITNMAGLAESSRLCKVKFAVNGREVLQSKLPVVSLGSLASAVLVSKR